MPLSSQGHLQTLLDRATVEALFDGIPDAAQPFRDADSLIERYIGPIPTPAPDALRVIAADIVIWSLTGRQQQISASELDRRETRFENALAKLEQLRTGVLKITHPAPPASPIIATSGRDNLEASFVRGST